MQPFTKPWEDIALILQTHNYGSAIAGLVTPTTTSHNLTVLVVHRFTELVYPLCYKCTIWSALV